MYFSETQQSPCLSSPRSAVLIINKHAGDQAPVTINCLRAQFCIFTKHQFAHGLLGALAERLAFLWRIHKSQTDSDLLLVGGQHTDRVAVGYGYAASLDRLWLQVPRVRDRSGLISVENRKISRENEQGNEF
jgi:hypothetical protein